MEKRGKGIPGRKKSLHKGQEAGKGQGQRLGIAQYT